MSEYGIPSLPHTGAWIETSSSESKLNGLLCRSLTRERGLKLISHEGFKQIELSLPHTGAWIETQPQTQAQPQAQSLPHTGAWIETSLSYKPSLNL